MPYRIDYHPEKTVKTPEYRRFFLTGLFFLIFLVAVGSFWAEGQAVLRGLVFSGDVAAVERAADLLIVQLKDGIPVMDAISAFCGQILEGSGYGLY